MTSTKVRKIKEAIAQMDGKLIAAGLPIEARREKMELLRSNLAGDGIVLNESDESLLELFAEGTVDARQLAAHFRVRLLEAADSLTRRSSGPLHGR